MRITPAGGLKILVATGPEQNADGITVQADVRLVRAALLYADEVELISPSALMIASVAAASAQGPDFLFELMETLDDDTLRYLGYDGDLDEMRVAMASIRVLNALPRPQRRNLLGAEKSREIRAMVQGLADQFLHGEEGFEAVANRLWEQAGAPDLGIAAEAGVLTLATDAFDLAAETSVQVQQYSDTIRRLLGDPTAHLMFDERVASLADALVREEQAELHPLTATHALRAATGTGLVERLPAFPDSPIETILEARTELTEPLVRYRAGVRDLTTKLLSGPLDPALKAEVTDLWRDEVQPSLVSLRADLSTTRLVRDVAYNLVTEPKAVIGGFPGAGLLFGVGSVSEVAQLATAGAVAASGLVINAGAQAVREAHARREAAATHDLYYLLALNDQLR